MAQEQREQSANSEPIEYFLRALVDMGSLSLDVGEKIETAILAPTVTQAEMVLREMEGGIGDMDNKLVYHEGFAPFVTCQPLVRLSLVLACHVRYTKSYEYT